MAFRLHNSVQNYAWGSRDGIERVFGIPNPTGDPVAEIWMGAHARAPSIVETESGLIPLNAYIAGDPDGTLGAKVRQTYGDVLPYLFKMLAAAEPLSIQAHPSRQQAVRGFARENDAGIARDDPTRNYRDANHKPELIYAMTPFWGMRGFRSPAIIRANLEHMRGSAALHLPDEEDDLPAFFRSLMTLAKSKLEDLLREAAADAARLWPDPDREPDPGDRQARYYWLRVLDDVHPGDPGVLAPLFLNVFCLLPGQATYQPAGVLHAYLRGVGVELMANSDNVLRGGLTVKHVDLDELMSIGLFRAEEEQVLSADDARVVADFPTPFADFGFSRLLSGSTDSAPGKPRVVLCAEGSMVLQSGSPLSLGRGESAFLRADEDVGITVDGRAFVATVGEQQ